MAEWNIDPTNPGEVLACAGIAHLAWLRDRAAVTGFEYEGQCRFIAPDGLLATLQAPPLSETQDGLQLAHVALDWWQEWGLNPALKTWAGQQTALSVHGNLAAATGDSPAREWQSLSQTTTGRLNVDVLGTWNALSNGWSVNEHKHIEMQCRPWLELLASIGLQAFPLQGTRSAGLRYHLWRPLPLVSAVAAFNGHGPTIYGVGGFITQRGKLGSNSMLLRAQPIDS